MDIQTILSTEMRLLEPICSFLQCDGYSIYRSERFPNYYGGNGIEIVDPRGRSLQEWESIFRAHFDSDRYEHTTFTFANADRFAPLMEQARSSLYHLNRTAYMFVDHTRDCRPLPPEFRIGRIESEGDWKRLHDFEQELYVDGDWYDPTYTGPDRLFEKTRFTSEAIGIEWFHISRRGSDEILAKLGIFSHAGIARLQDVETGKAHRRQGLGTYLVSFAIDHAINTLGTEGLALAADTDYYAIDLYRKLGFVEAGQGITLMKYPVKNPAHPDHGKE
jgi:ribosomal protein S18 acetylase RimI-like enzyme